MKFHTTWIGCYFFECCQHFSLKIYIFVKFGRFIKKNIFNTFSYKPFYFRYEFMWEINDRVNLFEYGQTI